MEGSKEIDARVPLERRHPDLEWILDRFHLNLDAVRGMLADFVPLVMRREVERFGPKALAQLESLDPERQEKLRWFLDDVTTKARSGLPVAQTPEEWAPLFGEVFENDQHSLVSFAERLRKRAAGPSPIIIVHNSLLTQAIAAFEVLVSSVATRFFIAHRNALGTDEKEFSLADLRGFVDIEDATDALIATRVAKLMFGGLEAWDDWFKSRCKLELRELAMDWANLVESFQRRHVVMHNGGLVSRQYLAKVATSEPPRVGDRLLIDDGYLADVFDQLDVLGTVLIVRLWSAWNVSERDQAANNALQRAYELMLEKRWAAAASICDWGPELPCSAVMKESIKANWLNSRLELLGDAAIKEDLDAWDVSASADRFKLAKLVFAGELEAASALADSLLASKELSHGQLNEWPILRRLREYRATASPQLAE